MLDHEQNVLLKKKKHARKIGLTPISGIFPKLCGAFLKRSRRRNWLFLLFIFTKLFTLALIAQQCRGHSINKCSFFTFILLHAFSREKISPCAAWSLFIFLHTESVYLSLSLVVYLKLFQLYDIYTFGCCSKFFHVIKSKVFQGLLPSFRSSFVNLLEFLFNISAKPHYARFVFFAFGKKLEGKKTL